jgi:hypothetical protein
MLDDIEEALKTLGLPVYYGVHDAQPNEEWNYIVFRRINTRSNANKTARDKLVFVGYVHEDYIDEDVEDKVREAVCALPGMREADADVAYEYVQKPSTGAVVEVMGITFRKSVKAY